MWALAIDHSTTNGAVKHMMAILGGLVMTHQAAELWWDGLDPERSTDERNLYELAKALKIDERTYNDLVLNALKLSTSDEFNHLVTTITGCLSFWPVLDHRHLVL
jgi:hypothetical protein